MKKVMVANITNGNSADIDLSQQQDFLSAISGDGRVFFALLQAIIQ